jgi:enoyl-CoA hydratase/carnithine racemase
MSVSLSPRGAVAVLDLGHDENRFTREWMVAVNAGLDAVLDGPYDALVTSASGRFYSNGLDLDWLGAHLDQYDPYVAEVESLVARILTFPMPTVAAVPGHAFGMGALLALAHDVRVMRRDQGYFCFPEVDLKLPFSPGMVALIQAKLSPRTALEAMATGRRYGGDDAAVAAIVDHATGLERVLETACDRAATHGPKDRAAVGGIKEALFAKPADLLQSGRD